eukprot:CAMPEP_0185851096 /NCGR_PEP_ID=MMETSP1354-20130828/5698_1 /TAXON_ID=708628 /ORGANISM="Erythrolobus madagascarensis, Strain CCMP3276" /LENGTH=248 /DNA_ID=CAMNT_0028551907 /DNA_START=62 /DNA_END=808 /DNA_ORIENTATION=+
MSGILRRAASASVGRRAALYRIERRAEAASDLVAAENAGDGAVEAESVENVVEDSSTEQAPSPFSAEGMGVKEFFERSVGEWKSQRSSHNLAWAQFEAVNSDISIESLALDHTDVTAICAQYETDAADAMVAIRMSWEGYSDWDEDEVMSGSTVLVVVEDEAGRGRLLRSEGYAETIPAVGSWRMQNDGVFVLDTFYDRAAAEERIWFATPDLRMRVSMIKTSAGSGVLTASFSSEIRKRPVPPAQPE